MYIIYHVLVSTVEKTKARRWRGYTELDGEEGSNMVLTECQGLFEKMISEEKLKVGKGTSHVCMWNKIGPRKGSLMCKGTEVGVCPVSSWNS